MDTVLAMLWRTRRNLLQGANGKQHEFDELEDKVR